MHHSRLYLLIASAAFAGLTGCATLSSDAESGQNIQTDSISSLPTVNLAESRSMFIYSLSRMHSLDGDFDSSLALLKAAMDADPANAYLHVAASQIFLKQNKLDQALEACDQAIKLNPKQVEAYVIGGNILFSLKKFKEAIGYYQKALELESSKEDVYLNLALACVKTFDYEQAVTVLKSLVKNVPDSAMGYYYLAKTYDQMKLPKEAVGYYKKALEIKPEFDMALIDIAIAQETAGMIDDAIKSYEELLDTAPMSANVANHLVQLYIHQNRLENALTLLQKSEKSGMGSGIETQRKIGLILMELERYPEAIKFFEQILEQEPNSHQIRYYLATAYVESDESDKAIAEFSKIPPTAFNYSDALGNIAFLYADRGDTEAAIDLLKKAIASDPGNLDHYLHLAGVYESCGRFADGVAILKKIEEKIPEDAKILFRVGILYDKLGDKEMSIDLLKRSLELNPDEAQVLNYLGYTYAELGKNLEEAIDMLKKAVNLRPTDGFILDSLGWAYFKQKQYEDATEALERAVELVGDDPTIRLHLGDAYYAKRELKKALAAYAKALDLDPEKPEAQEKVRKVKAEIAEK